MWLRLGRSRYERIQRNYFEAIVDDSLLRDEDDILSEYDSFEEAASIEGLCAFIDGSYEYTTKFSIVDVRED